MKPAIDWGGATKSFLENWDTITTGLARFAWTYDPARTSPDSRPPAPARRRPAQPDPQAQPSSEDPLR